MKAKYVNPFTDFGFKKIFGEEASKPLLIDFLNALLPAHSQVADLSFKNGEQLGAGIIDRKAIFDIYCEAQNGEKFIVELQKAKQNYFKDRTVFYSTFPIREQAEKGIWNFELKAVYCIGILDFTFDDYEEVPAKDDVVHTIKLKNQWGTVFYDKLTYIYLEMPNFKLGEDELQTRLDKWLFFIQHLEDFQSIPAIFKDAVFEEAFEKAALAQMDSEDQDRYEYSLKVYRDLKNTIDYSRVEGREEGRQEGRQEGRAEGKVEGKEEATLAIARTLKAQGIALEIIQAATGLSAGEIAAL